MGRGGVRTWRPCAGTWPGAAPLGGDRRAGERYSIRFQPDARRAISERLPESSAAVLGFCEAALAVSPQCVGKLLFGPLAGCHGARPGTYRMGVPHQRSLPHRPPPRRRSQQRHLPRAEGLIGVHCLSWRSAVQLGGRRYAKSQTKSRRPQAPGDTQPHAATTGAAGRHVRPGPATSTHKSYAPYKRGVTGSNPIAPRRSIRTPADL